MLDQSQVQKIAHLARLDITPEEEAEFAQQLSSILDYVEELSALPTDGIPPTTRAIEVSNITRLDQQTTWGDRQLLIDEAPEPEGDFFRVPKILSEEAD